MDEEVGDVPVHYSIREIQPYVEPGGSWSGSHLHLPMDLGLRDAGPALPIVRAPSEFDALVAATRRLLSELPGGTPR